MGRVKKDRGRRRRERRTEQYWADVANDPDTTKALNAGEVMSTWGLSFTTYEAPNHGWGIPLKKRWKTREAKGGPRE